MDKELKDNAERALVTVALSSASLIMLFGLFVFTR
jgi:hypothetical protein